MSATIGKAPLPPYFVYQQFLAPDQHAGLLEWTLEHRSGFETPVIGTQYLDSQTGSMGPIEYRPASALRSSLIFPKHVDTPWKPTLRKRAEQAAPDAFERVGMKPAPVSRIEIELLAYGDGTHFGVHRDTVLGAGRTADDRVLSGVYYFHTEPKGFSGGELRLHRLGSGEGAERDYIDIPPQQNSFVVFPSWILHEVRPVATSHRFEDYRFAINCWFRVARGERSAQ